MFSINPEPPSGMDSLQEVWQELAQQVNAFDYHDAKTGDDSLRELIASTKAHPIVLFAEEAVWKDNTCEVVRNGDLLVGFALPSNEQSVTLEVAIGVGADGRTTPVVSVETRVETGMVTYALEGLHCIPLINLAFHVVRVATDKQPPPGLRLVYAVLDTADRRVLAQGGCTHGMIQQLRDRYMVTRSGMAQDLERGVYSGNMYVVEPCT